MLRDLAKKHKHSEILDLNLNNSISKITIIDGSHKEVAAISAYFNQQTPGIKVVPIAVAVRLESPLSTEGIQTRYFKFGWGGAAAPEFQKIII